MIDVVEREDGLLLNVRARPGARKNAILPARAGELCVAVTAAPERGKANQAIVALLANELGIAKRDIEILSGETSPRKRVLLRSITREQLLAKLAQASRSKA